MQVSHFNLFMFQYISAFGHYPPNRPLFLGDRCKQYCCKQRARSGPIAVWGGFISRYLCCSPCLLLESVIVWLLGIYLRITHCPGAAHRSFILHRLPPCWYMELLHFYTTTLCRQSKHTSVLYVEQYVCVLKGKHVHCLEFFPSFILFKALYSAVLLLMPVLLLSFGVFSVIAIH